jgi:prolyl-tRNA synthetase
MMGGQMSQEFMIVNEDGEDHLVLCDNCDYAANAEAATFAKGEELQAAAKPIERIATPGRRTIAKVAEFVGVDKCQTLKAVFYTSSEGEFVFVLIRGDLDVNESKLSNVLGGADLQPAPQEVVEAAGLVPGYASPVGVQDVRIIADDSIKTGSNFVTGANEKGYHLKNVNYPRDFEADVVADIALATEGASCERCGGRLSVARGIEVGHLFALGTKYSKAMEATFLDQNGRAKPLIMGCYGIGLGRLMACIIEQHHDGKGIIWPPSVAPWPIHLLSLGKPESEVGEAAESLYTRLLESHGVLYDDRDCRAGIKFNDADLIGLPVRLVVSRRTLEQEAIELQPRWEDDSRLVPKGQLEEEIDKVLAHKL